VVVSLAAGPRRSRQLALFALIAATVGGALPALLAVYHEFKPDVIGHPSAGVLRDAGLALAIAAVAAAAAWLALTDLYARLDRRPAARLRTGFWVASAVALVLALGVGAGSLSSAAHRGYDEFRSLNFDKSGTSRFVQGGGARYDLWRVALKEGRAHPLRGVGAGNYAGEYLHERSQPNDVRQPHSIELQAFAELGVPGLLALMAFVGCVGWGAVTARRSRGAGAAFTAALGIFVVWLTQTSVDWLHNLPGITGLALVAAAVLMAGDRAARPSRGVRSTVLVGAALVLIGLASVSVGRQYVGHRYGDAARSALASSPQTALADVKRALAFGAAPIQDRYVAAAAYARLGDYADARRALRSAVAHEPSNSVPWLLLGDLELRRHSPVAALRAYRRSEQLNPLDPLVSGRIARATAERARVTR
jgi:tetratricopeptide (TPR) repeat protein